MQTTQFLLKTENKNETKKNIRRVAYEMKMEGGLMVSINKATVMSTTRVLRVHLIANVKTVDNLGIR